MVPSIMGNDNWWGAVGAGCCWGRWDGLYGLYRENKEIFPFNCVDQNQIDNIDGLVQERCNSNALAIKLCLSCTNPTIWPLYIIGHLAESQKILIHNTYLENFNGNLSRRKPCLVRKHTRKGYSEAPILWIQFQEHFDKILAFFC